MPWLIVALALLGVTGFPPVYGVTSSAPASDTAPAEHRLATLPVAGAVVRDFVAPATRYSAGHRGIDLAADQGTPVVAALGGVVSFSGTVTGVGWVTVDHGGGLNTTYGALSPRTVTAGQRVATGDVLGLVAEGRAHLDWGARLDGEYIDPLSLLARWESYLTTGDDASPALLAAAAALLAAPSAPTAGGLLMPAVGPVTSGFGPRVHPVTGAVRDHAGVDIGAAHGAPVAAAAGGVVAQAGSAGGYGQMVVLDHGGGLTTRYAHLSVIDVRAGQAVAAGARIGAVGSTGVSTGPHLHFEVRRGGVAQDPQHWLGG